MYDVMTSPPSFPSSFRAQCPVSDGLREPLQHNWKGLSPIILIQVTKICMKVVDTDKTV